MWLIIMMAILVPLFIVIPFGISMLFRDKKKNNKGSEDDKK